MIYEVMDSINNFFEIADGAHEGTWEITNGEISLPFLQFDQFFRVEGSVFNDGVYRYGVPMAKDEVFEGRITALAPPAAFLKVVEEITEWQAKFGTVGAAYTSESFGGYSYSKATNADGSEKTWRDMFRRRLRPWRKL